MREGLYKEKTLVSEGLPLIWRRAAGGEPGAASWSQAISSEDAGTWFCFRGRLATGTRSQGQRLRLHLLMSPKAGREPAGKKTKMLGSVLGCVWLDASGQEVRRRAPLVLPALPSPPRELQMFDDGSREWRGAGLVGCRIGLCCFARSSGRLRFPDRGRIPTVERKGPAPGALPLAFHMPFHGACHRPPVQGVLTDRGEFSSKALGIFICLGNDAFTHAVFWQGFTSEQLPGLRQCWRESGGRARGEAKPAAFIGKPGDSCGRGRAGSRRGLSASQQHRARQVQANLSLDIPVSCRSLGAARDAQE